MLLLVVVLEWLKLVGLELLLASKNSATITITITITSSCKKTYCSLTLKQKHDIPQMCPLLQLMAFLSYYVLQSRFSYSRAGSCSTIYVLEKSK